MFKILVLEDNQLLSKTLKEELEDEGYLVEVASTIEEAHFLTFEKRFELYIFDVNVPDGSGFQLLKELREIGDTTSTIFLTSKSEAKDVGEGFNVGADDYVKKPFDIEELLHRIKRFVKKDDDTIQINNIIKFNPQNFQITINEKTYNLQKKESEILHYFIKNPNKIISKDEVISNLFDGNYFSDTTFRVYITNLKKILGAEVIKNRRGSGYIFEKI